MILTSSMDGCPPHPHIHLSPLVLLPPLLAEQVCVSVSGSGAPSPGTAVNLSSARWLELVLGGIMTTSFGSSTGKISYSPPSLERRCPWHQLDLHPLARASDADVPVSASPVFSQR